MHGSRPTDPSTEATYRLDRWEEIVGLLTAVHTTATDEVILEINEQPVRIRVNEETDPNQYIGDIVGVLRTENKSLLQIVDDQ